MRASGVRLVTCARAPRVGTVWRACGRVAGAPRARGRASLRPPRPCWVSRTTPAACPPPPHRRAPRRTRAWCRR
eukprot:6980132-Prymnesium_polylepis.1